METGSVIPGLQIKLRLMEVKKQDHTTKVVELMWHLPPYFAFSGISYGDMYLLWK